MIFSKTYWVINISFKRKDRLGGIMSKHIYIGYKITFMKNILGNQKVRIWEKSVSIYLLHSMQNHISLVLKIQDYVSENTLGI
jgi:hypothetical protein